MKPNTTAQLYIRSNRRRGSVTVLALMVSLLVMVLVTATMTMTIIHNDVMGDVSRNKKTIQAADSGLFHAKAAFKESFIGLEIPDGVRPSDLDVYVQEALDGDTTNDADISLLVDSAANLDNILPRGDTVDNVRLSDDNPAVDPVVVEYNTSIDIIPTGVDVPASTDITYKHTFHYAYTLTSEGDANIGGQHNQATRVKTGFFDLSVERPSFATYGYFTEHMRDAKGNQLWFYDGEVYGGPTHVNSTTDSSAFYGNPTFTGDFSSVQGNPGDTYQTSGAIVAGGPDAPEFQQAQKWGVAPIDLPDNHWSQLRAAVGDTEHASDQNPVTDTELRTLMGMGGAGPISQGVYYAPNDNSTGSAAPLGGIYVKGDAAEIKFETDGDSQIVTITQNNTDGGTYDGAQTWVLRDNLASGSVTVTHNGSPAGTWSNTNLNGVIHVDGKVAALKGDGSSTPDIQPDAQITLSVANDIMVADNITYSEDPRGPDGVSGNADDTNPANVLGLFTSGGNVMLAKTAPADLQLHASVLAAANNKGVGAEGLATPTGYDKAYPDKGKWNLLGGLIENTDQTTGVIYSSGLKTGYTWNFNYDNRFKAGVAPPYFPYVTKFISSLSEFQDDWVGRKYY
jgi:hypothetical protein